MKSIKLLALLFVLGIAGAHAQTADELINKYVTAMGGADKLKALKTAYTEGSMEINGMELPVKTWIVQQTAMRMDFEVMGTSNTQVVTKSGGWSLMPVQGQSEATPLDSSVWKTMQDRLDVTGGLYNYKETGKKVEALGKETVEGVEAYKIKVTTKEGTELYVYLDPTTYYLSGVRIQMKVPGQDDPVEVVTKFSDYKKTDNGYTYAGLTEIPGRGLKIITSKADYNKPIDDSLFKMPAAK